MNKTLRRLLPLACVGAFAATAVVFAVEKPSVAAAPLAARAEALEGRSFLKFALERVADELELSEAQRSAAKDIIREHHDDIRSAFERSRAARAGLRGVIRSGKATEAELAAASDQVAAAARELALTTARLRVDLRLVLDDAQRAKIEELEARLQKRLAGLRAALAEEFGPV